MVLLSHFWSLTALGICDMKKYRNTWGNFVGEYKIKISKSRKIIIFLYIYTHFGFVRTFVHNLALFTFLVYSFQELTQTICKGHIPSIFDQFTIK